MSVGEQIFGIFFLLGILALSLWQWFETSYNTKRVIERQRKLERMFGKPFISNETLLLLRQYGSLLIIATCIVGLIVTIRDLLK